MSLLRSPWVRAALGGAAWSALVLWISSGGKSAPASPSTSARAERIALDPVPLEAGVMYAGAIVTHGGANFAGHDAVLSAAAKRGFVDVVADDRPIPGWPWSNRDADWYVVARYRGESKTQARHEGGFGGSADVVEAFRAVAA